jgi:hypothetical protein
MCSPQLLRRSHRSRITNRKHALPGIDGRSSFARRYRDLITAYTAEIGGNPSEFERNLIKQAAAFAFRGEALQAVIVAGRSGGCLEPEFTCRDLQLAEAFDRVPLLGILQTIRSLEIFSEESIGHYYAIAIRNKVAGILGPAVLPKVARRGRSRATPSA